MNLIPVVGPYDFKVYGSQKAFANRPTEFFIRSEKIQIEEILIIDPNGSYLSCSPADNQNEENLTIEFQPKEIGVHEIRILPDKTNSSQYNSFELNVYDSSKLKINIGDEAFIGRVCKFTVDCKSVGEGTLNVNIDQEERKLRPEIKQLKYVNTDGNYYEISFVPEVEGPCRIDFEYIDNANSTIYGDSIVILVRAIDFIIIPYPLQPFPINIENTFKIKSLREDVNEFKILIKQANETVECKLVELEKNSYSVTFTPKTIERHTVEIYFDDVLVNSEQLIKIDVFDVSKIKARMPSSITFGEMNTFTVDTTGAGEGNLEVIIKDGYDTLKAQLLKREKRKFEIGFVAERNMKHDIQIIFNGTQIRDSPFYIYPELLTSRSVEMIPDVVMDDYMVVEGGPLDGLQCGEKMWIIFDAQSAPYYDVQFVVVDDNNLPIKHTKIQLEDGRWRIEFIPINVGIHQIQRVIQADNQMQIHLLHKLNVLHYSAPRIVYGYKMYNIEDSVQLVFDAANFRVQDIVPEVKDPNDEGIKDLDCKYLSDYLALKFTPRTTGGYLINFFDRANLQSLASSPYKVIVHEDYKEIIRSSGIYDLTRLTIAASNLPVNYDLRQFTIIVHDTRDMTIQNCCFSNKKGDLIVEFITRIEGMHKIYLYLNDELVDDNPFLIYVNGDSYISNCLSGVFSNASPFKSYSNPRFTSSSSNDFGTSFSGQSCMSTSDSQIMSSNSAHIPIGHGTILSSKINEPFHFVVNDQNIQGLCVYDPLDDPIQFELGKDDHGNGSIVFLPKIEGTHKIVGLIEGRDFEAQLFVLNEPAYESLFQMNNYSDTENLVEKPFIISLKENNLEVDVYDPLGERVDVRYTKENLAVFIPRTTGYFKIYISDYHGPILGSPFYALIHAQKEMPDAANVVESSGIRDTIRNEEAKFIIRSKDLEIDVQIKNAENTNLVLRKKRTSQGYLQVNYTPETIGPHEIYILKDGIKTLGSPITVYVFDPNLVKIDSLSREGHLGHPFAFNINASEAGEGFIRVNVKDSQMNDVLPEITEYGDRTYLVKLVPKIQGIYEFSLTFNKYHVIESPFKVLINEGDLINKSALEDSEAFANNKLKQFEEEDQHQQQQQQIKDSPKVTPDLDTTIEKELEFIREQISREKVHRDELDDQEDIEQDKLADETPMSIDYEINNWNQNVNPSGNVGVSTLNQLMGRTLTPITDTSEDETSSSSSSPSAKNTLINQEPIKEEENANADAAEAAQVVPMEVDKEEEENDAADTVVPKPKRSNESERSASEADKSAEQHESQAKSPQADAKKLKTGSTTSNDDEIEEMEQQKDAKSKKSSTSSGVDDDIVAPKKTSTPLSKSRTPSSRASVSSEDQEQGAKAKQLKKDDSSTRTTSKASSYSEDADKKASDKSRTGSTRSSVSSEEGEVFSKSKLLRKDSDTSKSSRLTPTKTNEEAGERLKSPLSKAKATKTSTSSEDNDRAISETRVKGASSSSRASTTSNDDKDESDKKVKTFKKESPFGKSRIATKSSTSSDDVDESKSSKNDDNDSALTKTRSSIRPMNMSSSSQDDKEEEKKKADREKLESPLSKAKTPTRTTPSESPYSKKPSKLATPTRGASATDDKEEKDKAKSGRKELESPLGKAKTPTRIATPTKTSTGSEDSEASKATSGKRDLESPLSKSRASRTSTGSEDSDVFHKSKSGRKSETDSVISKSKPQTKASTSSEDGQDETYSSRTYKKEQDHSASLLKTRTPSYQSTDSDGKERTNLLRKEETDSAIIRDNTPTMSVSEVFEDPTFRGKGLDTLSKIKVYSRSSASSDDDQKSMSIQRDLDETIPRSSGKSSTAFDFGEGADEKNKASKEDNKPATSAKSSVVSPMGSTIDPANEDNDPSSLLNVSEKRKLFESAMQATAADSTFKKGAAPLIASPPHKKEKNIKLIQQQFIVQEKDAKSPSPSNAVAGFVAAIPHPNLAPVGSNNTCSVASSSGIDIGCVSGSASNIGGDESSDDTRLSAKQAISKFNQTIQASKIGAPLLEDANQQQQQQQQPKASTGKGASGKVLNFVKQINEAVQLNKVPVILDSDEGEQSQKQSPSQSPTLQNIRTVKNYARLLEKEHEASAKKQGDSDSEDSENESKDTTEVTQKDRLAAAAAVDDEPKEELAVPTAETSIFKTDDERKSANDGSSSNSEDEEQVINVANESIVTKMTKQLEKTIDQEETVVIEEKYVITDRDEARNEEMPEEESEREELPLMPARLEDIKEESEKAMDVDGDTTEDKDGEESQASMMEVVTEDEKKQEEASATESEKETDASRVTKEDSATSSNEDGAEQSAQALSKESSSKASQSSGLNEEKLSEKFKPEETIQYEYEQVIEQPSQHGDKRALNKDSIQIANTTKKTTKKETKEKFEKVEPATTPDKIKTTTTDKTTYLTQQETDVITETIESIKDTQEFSYQQMKNKKKMSDSTGEIEDSNLESLSEKVEPVVHGEEGQAGVATLATPLTLEAPAESLSEATPKAASASRSNDNILDYYNLQPKIVQEPVDLSTLPHGEQLKPHELTSFDDSASFSKSVPTTNKKAISNLVSKKEHEDEEDSLAEVDENLHTSETADVDVTETSAKQQDSSARDKSNESAADSAKGHRKYSESPLDANSYYKPIEKMTPEDFFNASAENNATRKPIDTIKARFERSNPKEEKDVNKSESSQAVGKLAKSIVDMYDAGPSADEKTSSRKASKSSVDENDAVEKKPAPLATAEDDESIYKRPKKQPIVGAQRKSSSSDPTQSAAGNDEDSESYVSSGGVKNLVGVYEKKPEQGATAAAAVAHDEAAEPVQTPSASAEGPAKPVRKLSKTIVEKFDSESQAPPVTASKRSAEKPLRSVSSRSASSSASSKPGSVSDEVALAKTSSLAADHANDAEMASNEAAPSSEKHDESVTTLASANEKVKKLAKSIIDHYEKRSSVGSEDKDSATPERKLSADDHQQPRKLSKSTLEMYERKRSASEKPNVSDVRRKSTDEDIQKKKKLSAIDPLDSASAAQDEASAPKAQQEAEISDDVFVETTTQILTPNVASEILNAIAHLQTAAPAAAETTSRRSSKGEHETAAPSGDKRGVKTLVDRYEKKSASREPQETELDSDPDLVSVSNLEDPVPQQQQPQARADETPNVTQSATLESDDSTIIQLPNPTEQLSFEQSTDVHMEKEDLTDRSTSNFESKSEDIRPLPADVRSSQYNERPSESKGAAIGIPLKIESSMQEPSPAVNRVLESMLYGEHEQDKQLDRQSGMQSSVLSSNITFSDHSSSESSTSSKSEKLNAFIYLPNSNVLINADKDAKIKVRKLSKKPIKVKLLVATESNMDFSVVDINKNVAIAPTHLTSKPSQRGISFNYDSIVDFEIAARPSDHRLPPGGLYRAKLVITTLDNYKFHLVKKNTREEVNFPAPVYEGSKYMVLFNLDPTTSYILESVQDEAKHSGPSHAPQSPVRLETAQPRLSATQDLQNVDITKQLEKLKDQLKDELDRASEGSSEEFDSLSSDTLKVKFMIDYPNELYFTVRDKANNVDLTPAITRAANTSKTSYGRGVVFSYHSITDFDINVRPHSTQFQHQYANDLSNYTDPLKTQVTLYVTIDGNYTFTLKNKYNGRIVVPRQKRHKNTYKVKLNVDTITHYILQANETVVTIDKNRAYKNEKFSFEFNRSPFSPATQAFVLGVPKQASPAPVQIQISQSDDRSMTENDSFSQDFDVKARHSSLRGHQSYSSHSPDRLGGQDDASFSQMDEPSDSINSHASQPEAAMRRRSIKANYNNEFPSLASQIHATSMDMLKNFEFPSLVSQIESNSLDMIKNLVSSLIDDSKPIHRADAADSVAKMGRLQSVDDLLANLVSSLLEDSKPAQLLSPSKQGKAQSQSLLNLRDAIDGEFSKRKSTAMDDPSESSSSIKNLVFSFIDDAKPITERLLQAHSEEELQRLFKRDSKLSELIALKKQSTDNSSSNTKNDDKATKKSISSDKTSSLKETKLPANEEIHDDNYLSDSSDHTTVTSEVTEAREESLSHLSELHNLLHKTKLKLDEKLRDMVTKKPIEIKLLVAHDHKLDFKITDFTNNHNISATQFTPTNNQHGILFEYDSIVDFGIKVKEDEYVEHEDDIANQTKIKALLHVATPGNYIFKLVNKRTGKTTTPPQKRKDDTYMIGLNVDSPNKYVLQAISQSKEEVDNLHKYQTRKLWAKTINNHNIMNNLIPFKRKSTIIDDYSSLRTNYDSVIKVKLLVTYGDTLNFSVFDMFNTKAITPYLINPRPNKQGILFAYTSIVDFEIGLSKLNEDQSTSSELNTEPIRAKLYITTNDNYHFQFIKKENKQQMIRSTPKRRGKTYVMKFNFDRLTTYVLAATRLIGNEPKTLSRVENITHEQILNDKIPNNSFNFTNDINLRPKIVSASSDPSGLELSRSTLNCRVYNPNNLKVQDFQTAVDTLSFIINTESAGLGDLRCFAKHADGSDARLEQRKLDEYIFSIKIYGDRNRMGDLDLYLEHFPRK